MTDRIRFRDEAFLCSWTSLGWRGDVLDVVGLDFQYSGQPPLFSGLSFRVRRTSIVTLFGPNGSGKSTLLSIISGALSDQMAKAALPSTTYMLQDCGLAVLPWLTVAQNLQLGARVRISRRDTDSRIDGVIQAVPTLATVREWLDRPARELSGGEKQLVALLRALIAKASLILLDEPISSIDLRSRLSLLREVQGWCGKQNATVICSMHSVDEALLFSDRVLVLPQAPVSTLRSVDSSSVACAATSFQSAALASLRTDVLGRDGAV